MFKTAADYLNEHKTAIIGLTAFALISAGASLIGSAIGEVAGRGIAKALGLGDVISTEN